MPAVPSFKGYAEKPDLAGAYLGARRADIAAFQAATEAQLGRQRLAQDAAQAQARIDLGQQELESRRVQNEMELAARKETQEREHLRKQQEAEILKSYRDTQIGLAERRLKIAEAEERQRIKDAAQAFDQQQYFTKRFSELMSQPGMTSEKAASQAVLEIGPKATGFSSALTPPREPAARMDEVEKIKFTSTLENIDRELAEQRRILAEAEKPSTKYKESTESKYEREQARNRALRTLRSLEKKRNELFESAPSPSSGWIVPPESIPFGAPTTPQIPVGTNTIPSIPLQAPTTNAPSRLRVLSIQRQ